jgi:hypothetical protein
MLFFGFILIGIAFCMLIPVLITSIYLYFLTIYSLLLRKLKLSNQPKSKIALIIPLNKNLKNIEHKASDIFKIIDYPTNLYDIIFVTDNFSNSEQISTFKLHTSGVKIIHYTNSWRTGREFTIEWALAELIKKDYSAFFIMNQNSTPVPWIFKALAYKLEQGIDCIQMSESYIGQNFTWEKRLKSILLAAYNHLLPKGKSVLGLSCGLSGNGICLSKNLINTFPYKPLEYKNWFEYHIKLVLQNKKAIFISKTALYNNIEFAFSNENSLKHLPLIVAVKRYLIPLYKATLNGNWSAFDCLLTLFRPSIKTIVSILFLALFAGSIVYTASILIPECEQQFIYAKLIIFSSAVGIAALLFFLSIAMLEKKLSPITWLAGFFFPIYGLYSFVKKFIKQS